MTRSELLAQHPELQRLEALAITIQNRVGDKIQIDYLEIMLELLLEHNPEVIEEHGGLVPALEYHANFSVVEEVCELFLLGGEEEGVIERMSRMGQVDIIALARPLYYPDGIFEPCYDVEVWADDWDGYEGGGHYVAQTEPKVPPLDRELIREYIELHKRIMKYCRTVLL